MDEIKITLTEDEFVRLLDIAGRLTTPTLGDPIELWTELRDLLTSNADEQVPVRVMRRVTDVVVRLRDSVDTATELEKIWHESSPEKEKDNDA